MKKNLTIHWVAFCTILCAHSACCSEKTTLPNDQPAASRVPVQQLHPLADAIQQLAEFMAWGIETGLDAQREALDELEKKNRGIKFSKQAKAKQAATTQWIAQERAKIAQKQEQGGFNATNLAGLAQELSTDALSFWPEYEEYAEGKK